MQQTFWRFAIGLVAVIWCAACAEQAGMTTAPPRGKALRIGAILPLSGKYRVYGEATLHGIECAAGKQTPCNSPIPIELHVKDSGGDPSRAASAVTELVQEHQVAGIIGPLLSRTVEAAAGRAQELKVPLISLSQRDGIAEIGNYIFRVGLNAASQVETIARYAVKERGWKKIAIVYPENTYGETLRTYFRNAATALGASIVAEKGYAAGIANIVEARHEGGEADEAAKARPKPGSLSTSGEVVPLAASEAALPVVPRVRGAEAVFMPDSYRSLLTLLKLGGSDIFGGAVLLGGSRWNSAGLLAAGDRVEGAVFVDAFFPRGADVPTQQFVRTFAEAYRIEPTLLEAQAFDAVRLFIRAAQDARSRAPANVRDALARTKNVAGVTGRISFNAEGDAIKQLHLLTVRAGAIQQIEAPSRPVTQSAIGRSARRAAPAGTDPKYDIGGPAESSIPPLTERDKYE
ncbi:MAG: penicillin-binding protein activator [Deltaproteobacteria bacterium]|nr:penicillin-binding protein activator [Deltaproteobacteria bacterium]